MDDPDTKDPVAELAQLRQRVTELEMAAAEHQRTEKELVGLRHTMRMAQEIAMLGSWSWDIAANQVWWSDEFFRILGFEPQEVEPTAELYWEIVHPNDLPKEREASRLALSAPGNVYDLEHRIIRPDGSDRIVRSRGKVTEWDNAGRPLTMVGTTQDITEWAHAKVALAHSEEKYRALFETMAQGVVYQDNQGLIVSANPAAERILGLSLDQMQGRTSVDPRWRAIHPDGSDFPGDTHPAMIALRTGQAVRNVIMGVFHPQKEAHVWINVNAIPQFKPGDESPYRVYSTFDDITERIQVNEELRRHRERLEDLVRERTAELHKSEEQTDLILWGADLGTWDWNVQTGQVAFNTRWAEILGYTPEEIEPRIEAWERLLHPDEVQRVSETLQKNLDGELPFYECEHRLLTKSGQWKSIQARGKVVERDQDGRPLRHAGIYLDIDLRKQTEKELANYRDHLEDLVSQRTTQLSTLNESLQTEILERKRAEEALRQEKDRAQKYLDIAGVMLVALNAQGEVTLINQKGRQVLGYEQNEILGKNWFETVLPPDLKDEVRVVFEKLMAGEIEPVSYFENPILTKDGEKRVIAWRNTYLENDKGEIVGSLSSGEDITERIEAERKLREQEKVLRDILEVTLSGYWDWNIPANTEYLSPAFKKMFGYEDHELPNLPETWQKLIFPEDLPGTLEVFDRHVQSQGEEPYYNEVRYQHKDRSTIWVICAGRIIEWADDGAPIRMIGCHIDITERKWAEEALKASEKQLAEAQRIAHMGSWEWDIVENTTVWSDELYRIFGVEADQFDPNAYEAFLDCVHPQDRQRVIDVMEKAMDEKSPFDVNYRIVQPDETVRHIYARGEVTCDKLGRPSTMIGSSQDITDQVRTEAAEREQRALATALLETAEMINSTLDLVKVLERVLFVVKNVVPHDGANIMLLEDDRKALRLVQHCVCYQEHGLNNPVVGQLWQLEDFSHLRQMVDDGIPLIIADTLDHPSWSQDMTTNPIRSYLGAPIIIDDQVIGLLNLDSMTPNFFDTKHQEHLQAVTNHVAIAIQNARLHESVQSQLLQLREAQTRLVQSEKLAAIGELVAGVAHELNNPLTSVILYAQMLPHIQDQNKIKKNIQQIIEQTRRATGIVSGLMDFARQRPVKRIPAQINDTLNSTVSLLAYELRTRNVKVESEFDPDLPLIVADPHQLQQVFVNLINNAMQAMQGLGDSRLWIKTTTGPSQFLGQTANADQMVRITFPDNGPGIPKDHQSRIFDPFFTTKDVGEGTGLGLSICHGIIGDHRGHIWVESEAGEGATFFIELPIEPSEDDSAANDQDSDGQSESEVGAETARILVVDDEEAILEAVTLSLQEYHVDRARNGDDALNKVAANAYDLILCDLHMPGMSGIDFYRQLQSTQPHLLERILFITGDSISGEAKTFLQGIATEKLHKPFDVAALRSAVKKTLLQ